MTRPDDSNGGNTGARPQDFEIHAGTGGIIAIPGQGGSAGDFYAGDSHDYFKWNSNAWPDNFDIQITATNTSMNVGGFEAYPAVNWQGVSTKENIDPGPGDTLYEIHRQAPNGPMVGFLLRKANGLDWYVVDLKEVAGDGYLPIAPGDKLCFKQMNQMPPQLEAFRAT